MRSSIHLHKHPKSIQRATAFGVILLGGLVLASSTAAAQDPDRDDDLAILPPPAPVVASTVPSNGDQNPYGVVFVGKNFAAGGKVKAGDVLVSNFNNSVADKNQQGTGRTIVSITPSGTLTTFFQGGSGLGLTTALGLLKAGLVVVGNLPTTNGACATATAGSLLVIDKNGNQLQQLSDSTLLNGPWDMAVNDEGSRAQLFVSDVFSGEVVRVNVFVSSSGLTVESITRIASGYLHRCDPVALVVGPTGLVYDAKKDVLYVASTEDNAVYSIAGAKCTNRDEGRGTLIYKDDAHLHGPLGMVMTPTGHLIVSNSDVINPDPNQPSELVEFTVEGKFVAELSLDPNFGGAFGLAFAAPHGDSVRFAA
ncbi:MAG: hypothetical protein JO097_14680, partial [Acidobacteriaceae bacterium]|nr:hypothetical protein [Acidobacteriaceae bacterium]